MVSNINPLKLITLVKVGKLDNPLEEAVKKSRESFIQIPLNLIANAIKYASVNKSPYYMLMVSQNKDKSLSSKDYNTILTATSYSNKINTEIAEKFEYDIGMTLHMQVPEFLQKNFDIMSEMMTKARENLEQ
jgi:hypothetical protein